jgi:hypothetical protein
VYPLLHAKPQALPTQAAVALATLVVQLVHAAPLPPHAVGDVPAVQPVAQQPPLHSCVDEHAVVQVPAAVSHA